MALVIPLIVAGVAAAELVLRYQASRVLSFDVEHFPYYRRPKNAQGKEAYFVEREGWDKPAVMHTYSEGIRGDIEREHKKGRKLILGIGCSFMEGAYYSDN